MNKVIEQTIRFENTPPETLFDIFTDPEKHAAIIGSGVIISAKEGAEFSCFDGNVTGRNLLIIPGKMIVQSWRGNVWKKNDPDSVLILVFTKVKSAAEIYMAHNNTPKQFVEQWDAFYWKPLKRYLKLMK